jgi:flagellar hook-associated protein 3 FlgL
MRITDANRYDASIRTIADNMERMDRAQRQVSSGRRLNRPADDPVDAATTTRLRAGLAGIDSYTRNLDDAEAWLGFQDTALQSASSVMTRARELTNQAMNGSLGTQARNAIATELEGLRTQLGSLANTTYQGQPVFGGFGTTAVTLSATTATFSGTTGLIDREISAGQTVQVNTDGQSLFGLNAGVGSDVFSVLASLATAVRAGDQAGMTSASGLLEARAADILGGLGSVGARGSMLRAVRDNLSQQKLTLETRRSTIEDADMTQSAVELSRASLAYDAALAAVAKAHQRSLLDYLR